MATRFRIHIEGGGPPTPDSLKFLSDLTRESPESVMEWLDHLPHTVVLVTTDRKAENVRQKLAELGFKAGIQPQPQPAAAANRADLDWEVYSSLPKSRRTSRLTTSAGFITLIFLLFLAAVFLAYIVLNETVLLHHQQPGDLIQKGSYQNAEEAATRSIEAGRGNAGDYLNRAKAKILRIRKWGESSGWRSHLTSRSWNEPLSASRNYYRSPTGDSALADLRQALRLNPKDPEIHKWLGILYRERQELEPAVRAFVEALKRNIKDVEALNFLAITYLDLDRPEKAEALLLKALKVSPKDPRSLKNAGSFYLYEWGDTLKGLDFYRRYLKLPQPMDFERPVIRKEVTAILWHKYLGQEETPGNPPSFSQFEKERVRLLKKLEAGSSAKDQVLKRLGHLFYHRGMPEEAVVYWNQSLQANPEQPELFWKVIQVEGRQGHFSTARGYALRSARAKNTNPAAYFVLGLLERYYEENRGAAVKAYKKYLETGHSLYRRETTLELQELYGK